MQLTLSAPLRFTALLALGFALCSRGGSATPAAAPHALAPAVELFDLAAVRLGPGPFHDAMERDATYLLGLEPNRLLHTFRLNVGLPSTAEPYGGWENPDSEVRGHCLGHYLSACALMYRSTGDAVFKQRVDYLVAALAQCQAASPRAGFHEGYLAAFPESFIDRVETGQPVWAPWYTIHKIMAGLFDASQLTGNSQALDVLQRMAGWVKFRVDRLPPAQMQASLENEQGGMTEVLANLYGLTANPDYLRLARAFEHAAVLAPLARGEDRLDGLHANTQIPKIIGAARAYELTGDPRDRTIAETFWTSVADRRSYVTGGHSDREHFFPVSDFVRHVTPETTETCNTYNLLKLTRHLYAWRPDAHLIDFYERALYNHILASQDPAQGSFVYLLSLAPGHFKTYSTAENSFWCCVGTGMENHAKYGDTIFAHTADALYVNLFIAADLTWRERGVQLRQETRFPAADTTRLVWTCATPTDLALRIRHPAWAAGPLAVTVNGQPAAGTSTPGGYFELRRTWRTGDRVEVRFPLALHSEKLPGTDDLVAVLYGPIVLAGKLGNLDLPAPYARDQLDQARFPDPAVPAFVTTEASWLSRIEFVSRAPLLFRTHGLAQPHDVLLAPLYATNHERYAVYWRVLTPAAWAQIQMEVKTTAQQWSDATAVALDRVDSGNVASESSHRFVGTRTDSGTVDGRGWRQAHNGGSFSYELQTKGRAGPLTLVCAFGSRDVARNFQVFVGGRKIAEPQPGDTASGAIHLERFSLPPDLTAGQASLTMKFSALEKWDASTANVLGCALVPTPEKAD